MPVPLQLCLPLLLRHDATLLRPLLAPEDLSRVTAACGKYLSGDTALADPPSSTLASYHASTDSQRPVPPARAARGTTSGTSTGAPPAPGAAAASPLQPGSQQAGSERWASAMELVRGAVHRDARQDAEVKRALSTLWDNAEVREMVRTRLLPLVRECPALPSPAHLTCLLPATTFRRENPRV